MSEAMASNILRKASTCAEAATAARCARASASSVQESHFMQAHQALNIADEIGGLTPETLFNGVQCLGIEDVQLEQQSGDAGIGIGSQLAERPRHLLGKLQGVLTGAQHAATVNRAHEVQRVQHARWLSASDKPAVISDCSVAIDTMSCVYIAFFDSNPVNPTRLP
jgi:hypothetical protein